MPDQILLILVIIEGHTGRRDGAGTQDAVPAPADSCERVGVAPRVTAPVCARDEELVGVFSKGHATSPMLAEQRA